VLFTVASLQQKQRSLRQHYQQPLNCFQDGQKPFHLSLPFLSSLCTFPSSYSSEMSFKVLLTASWCSMHTFCQKKRKRIPSIFKDESTGSCIRLRSLIYTSHVNKVQPIRVKTYTTKAAMVYLCCYNCYITRYARA
jgi:hypothetical protein